MQSQLSVHRDPAAFCSEAGSSNRVDLPYYVPELLSPLFCTDLISPLFCNRAFLSPIFY